VLCLGFHPSFLILLMSSSMFLTSPFQPLSPSTPPVNLNLTSLSFVSFMVISAVVLTSVWSSEPICCGASGFVGHVEAGLEAAILDV